MCEDTFDAEDLEPPGRPARLESWKTDSAVKYPFASIPLNDNLARIELGVSGRQKYTGRRR